MQHCNQLPTFNACTGSVAPISEGSYRSSVCLTLSCFGDTLPKQLARNAVRSKLFLNGSQESRFTLLILLYNG